MNTLPFCKGHDVIYGTYGICHIEDVCLMSTPPDGAERMHYILSQHNRSGLTINVPADNEALVSRMRNVFSKEKIDELLSHVKNKEILWIDDKRARAARYHDILTKGVEEELMLMIRSIYLRGQQLKQNGKRLNVSDETTLKAAQKLVTEEFAYALCIEPDDVGAYIRRALDIEDDIVHA